MRCDSFDQHLSDDAKSRIKGTKLQKGVLSIFISNLPWGNDARGRKAEKRKAAGICADEWGHIYVDPMPISQWLAICGSQAAIRPWLAHGIMHCTFARAMMHATCKEWGAEETGR